MDRIKRMLASAAGSAMICAMTCAMVCLPGTTVLAQKKNNGGANNAAAGKGMTTSIPGALPGIRLISPVPNG